MTDTKQWLKPGVDILICVEMYLPNGILISHCEIYQEPLHVAQSLWHRPSLTQNEMTSCLQLVVLLSVTARGQEIRLTLPYESVCLDNHNDKTIYEMTLDGCAAACLSETSFKCCSFDFFDIGSRRCYLSADSISLYPEDIELPCDGSDAFYRERNLEECLRWPTTKVPKTTLIETTTKAETTSPETTKDRLTTIIETTKAETTSPETTKDRLTTIIETTKAETTSPETTKDQLTTLIETTTREETTYPVTTKDRLTTVIETTKEKTTFPHVLTSLRTSNIQDTTTEIISPTFDESMSTTEAPSKEEAKNVFFAAKKATSNSPIKSTGQRQPTSLTTKTSTSIPQTKSAETPTDYASLSIFPLRELSTYSQRNMSPMVDSFVTGATTISSLSTQLTEDKSNKTTQRRLPPLKGNKLAHRFPRMVDFRQEPSHVAIGCSFLLVDFSFLILVFVTDFPRLVQHLHYLNVFYGWLFKVDQSVARRRQARL
ncbi:hypothetical protein CAPTEDRAFT_201044 [Capitella teleta]|uniref:Apple domain-containing protein n=1 Tax=Capitella teleta TaxID=283909 RepID=R7TI76_CAPTE|nr:hypothetical protein CAPTEDRAFT_201044 [Capitella teleta]|eukprot:ELT90780.1 hypothetical protein CAPTEDRAFT_201044 [Capitella teleta]